MTSDDSTRKVLLLSNIFPPAIGGPATFMQSLATALHEKGKRVTVLCSIGLDANAAAERSSGIDVKRCPIENRYRYEIEIRLRILKELFFHRVILVNGLEDYVYPLARLLNRTYVLKIVGDAVWERARNLGTTSLDFDTFQALAVHESAANVQAESSARLDPQIRAGRAKQLKGIAQASVVVTPSEYLRKVVIGWGVSPEKVIVIPNAHSGAKLAAAEPPVTGGAVKLLFVGRLTNWKGLETALIALKTLPSAVSITVCGDGPQLPSMRSLARQLEVQDRCDFKGRVNHAEVLHAMQTHHALVLTSLYEGLSHTLLDALALGLPVIASNCGGNAELVRDGIEGRLVAPEDPSHLAAAVRAVTLESTQYWSDLSEAAQLRAKDFSPERMIESYSAALTEPQ